MPFDVAEVFARRAAPPRTDPPPAARAPERSHAARSLDEALASLRRVLGEPWAAGLAPEPTRPDRSAAPAGSPAAPPPPSPEDEFLAPVVAADYDGEGRLVITPGWLDPSTGSVLPLADATPESPEEGGFGRDARGAWRLLEPVPAAHRSFHAAHAPRVIEGDEIPAALARLRACPLFRPSARVAGSRVLDEPARPRLSLADVAGGWLDLDARYLVGSHEVALGRVLEAAGAAWLREGDDFIRAPGGPLLDALRAAGPSAFRGCVRLPIAAYVRARAGEAGDVLEEASAPAAAALAALAAGRPVAPAPTPAGYRGTLRPYQRAGLDWLWALRAAGLGGVLADEMGLGKTHMTLALLAAAAEDLPRGPSLVIAPASVVGPWIEKTRAFAPGLAPVRYEGPRRAALLEGLTPRSVVVASYGVLVRDAARLAAIEWEAAVLDEAQRVKNAATRAAQAARALRARVRVALTGTPVENRPAELHALFDFALPGYLGPASGFAELERRIAAGDREAAIDLRRILRPFTLRRRKRDVLPDLPGKREETRFCDLSSEQAALYREVLAQARKDLLPGLADRGRRVEYIPILAAITRLKRICDHPALALPEGRGADLPSGKLDLFREVLDGALAAGRKVVVFTQYLEMMDLLAREARARGAGVSTLRGATRDREAAVAHFQRDPACRVMVVSLLAGGVGIDLTEGSVVVHYDRWWNAAREDQATDRVHRIGQTREVEVVRLVTRGTVEEKIDALIAARARLLDDLVEAEAGGLLAALDRSEIASLFG